MAKKEKSMKKQETNKNKKSFFKDFKAELKRVNWPTPKQLVNNTIAVITIVLITAVIVFILDFAFEALNRNGINKLKILRIQKTQKQQMKMFLLKRATKQQILKKKLMMLLRIILLM